MKEKTESKNTLDRLYLLVSALFIVLSVVMFYYFSSEPLVVRVIGILLAFGISLAIFLKTILGKEAWLFTLDTRTEIRKVVWPTRAETMQTTTIVFIVVIIAAIFLWLFDMMLLWCVRLLTGQGG